MLRPHLTIYFQVKIYILIQLNYNNYDINMYGLNYIVIKK